jgi:excisionase family DNA binding protein
MTDHDRPQGLGYGEADKTRGGYPKSADPNRLLTLTEAAERLAVSISTVRRVVTAGELKTVRIGKAVRVRLTDLDAYIRTHAQG